jgi:hypothetical protein
MKVTAWIISAGLVLATAAANAQTLAPHGFADSRYSAVSDIGGPYIDSPYGGMPLEAPAPRYYGGPMLLPPQEIYAIVRESGFSPLGIPHQRGFVYTIAVVDRSGDDGRLVIDARTGRIIRFLPAYRIGDQFEEDSSVLPPFSTVRGPPRPPMSVPHVASRTPSVPMPKAAPPHAGEARQLSATPAAEPAHQSAAVQAKPAEPTPQAVAPAPAGAAPAAPQIQPTQEMPKVQGLD